MTISNLNNSQNDQVFKYKRPIPPSLSSQEYDTIKAHDNLNTITF